MLRTFVRRLSQLPRNSKQLFLALMDTFFVVFALWAAYSLRFGVPYEPFGNQIWLWVMAPALALPVFVYFDLYRAIIRYIGFKAMWSLFQAVSLYALLWGVASYLSGIPLIPRSVILLNWMLCLFFVAGARMLVRWWFVGEQFKGGQKASAKPQKNVMIYGAGAAGVQLALLLHYDSGALAVAYIDDNPEMQGHYVNGLIVVSPDEIEDYIKRNQVDEILLAIPSLRRSGRKEILARLEPYPVMVRTLPAVAEIAQGKVKIEDIREVDIADLLGRDAVDPIASLLDANVKDKVVMVTGAGGSIGSELCRQILGRSPQLLVLYEISEFLLYQIELELGEKYADKLVCVLGSVQNQPRLESVFERYQVHTIYHAAAYKHVPMIESNPIEGVENNIFGTLAAAKAAQNTGVGTFVLVSTDKAVRPTNVMGATKRFAELILQAMSVEGGGSTRYTMVRFGNVLGSSGSVVPLFRDQIRVGGPVTVTSDDMVRYFMTIREAALLVIQAGAMGEHGGLYVLKMGEPVRILDLAKQMIHLSGLEVKDASNPEGDIEIELTGLRPGEKRYEELLIDGSSSETTHPRIFAGHEHSISFSEVEAYIDKLKQAIDQNQLADIQQVFHDAVNGYQPDHNITDLAAGPH